jgi:transposase
VTTKILALADALGNLADVRLLPGQAHDLRGTAALIEGLTCGQFLADRAFDANWLRDALIEVGIEPVIPPKSNRRVPAEFDREIYKWRHLIENFFGKLKEYRGIAMRCCKTDESFSAFIALAATVIRLR